VESGQAWQDKESSRIVLLKDFSHELAMVLRGLEIADSERQQVANMQALHGSQRDFPLPAPGGNGSVRGAEA